MKTLIHTIFLAAFSLLLIGQASAQSSCSNMSNRARNTSKDNHVFGGQVFGQSFKADPACMSGSKFSEFSFWSQGNSPTKFDLAIYDGEIKLKDIASLQPRYSQSDIKMPPANFGGKLTVKLEGGRGDLSFSGGSYYTIICTIAKSGGGNLIAHSSPNATEGHAYLKESEHAESDLIFEIAAEGSDIVMESADYGVPGSSLMLSKRRDGRDLTSRLKAALQKMADAGDSSFKVNNQTVLYDHGLPDPAPGKRKKLIVKYRRSGGSLLTVEAWEKDTFTFK